MAVQSYLDENLRTAVLTALNTALGAAALFILFDGTQPATNRTAVSGNTEIVRNTGSSSFFQTPSGGAMTSNTITGAAATANGNPVTWGTLANASTPTTRLFDMSYGVSNANIIGPSVSISSGTNVSTTQILITTTG
jgi:hypothetical protein